MTINTLYAIIFVQRDRCSVQKGQPHANGSDSRLKYAPTYSLNIHERIIIMNINSILNTALPFSLYEKEKGTRDKSFMEVLSRNISEAIKTKQEADISDKTVQTPEETAPAKAPVNSFVYNIDENGNIIMPYSAEDIEAMRRYEAVKEAIKNGEVIDLAEKYNMQTVEVHESKDIDWDNITILTREQVEEMLSQKGHYLFEPTGDPKKDKIIELTLLYRKSCVDYTHSAEFDKLTREMDLTGMSSAEKYRAIYEKYKYCYGENFTDVGAINYPLFGLEYGTQFHIYSQFEDEVNEACGGAAAAQKARIEALYGKGLKASEVRQMIIDKYYYEGMTLRDMLKMTNEMRLCGVDGGITNLLDPVSNPGTYFVNEPTDQYVQITNRESILDEPVSKEFMRKMYNSFKARITVHPDLPGIVGMLMDLFNADAIDGGISADNDIFAHVWDKFK